MQRRGTGSNWALGLGLLGYQVGNGPCLAVGVGDQHEGCCKVQARDVGARPGVVAVEEEPCLGSGSIFKVEPTILADQSGLGHERNRSQGCVQRWPGREGLGRTGGWGLSSGPAEFEMPVRWSRGAGSRWEPGVQGSTIRLEGA